MQGRSAVPDQDPGPGPGPGPGTAAATLQMLQQEQARLEQLQKVLAEQLRHIRQQQIALIMAQQPDPSMAPALAQPLQAASAAAEDEVHSNSSQLSLLNTRLHEQDGIPAGARFPGQVATQTVDDREKDSLGGAGDITPLQVPVGRPTFAQMTAESLGAGQPWKQNTGAQGAESLCVGGAAEGVAHQDDMKEAIRALMILQQAEDLQAAAASQALAARNLSPAERPEKRRLVMHHGLEGSAVERWAEQGALPPLLAAAPLLLSLSGTAVSSASGRLPSTLAQGAAPDAAALLAG